MQVGRFDPTAADYSKMNTSHPNGKITYYDSDSESSVTNGKYNEGLSHTPISSDTDLNNIVIEAPNEDVEQVAKMTVFTDDKWVHVSTLGVHHNKQELASSLKEFYSTKVESRRACFHQEMSGIEHKVNDILYTVHTLDPKVRFQRMGPSCFYEIKGSNEIDVFLILDHVFDLNEFKIEQTMDLEDCVQIRRTNSPTNLVSMEERQSGSEDNFVPHRSPLEPFCVKSTAGSDYVSAKAIGSHFKDLVLRTFQCLPKEWRESHPECKLNSQVHKLDVASLTRSKSFHKNLNEKRVSFQDDQRYVVNLIPTLSCPNYWPKTFKRYETNRELWPDHALLNHVIEQGVHLVAMPTDKDREDVWKVKFFNAHRALSVAHTGCEQQCLRIVKVLCENDLGYSRYFLPSFLENIALHLHEQYPQTSDWTDDLLPARFLESLANIYQAMKTRKCMHFFIPQINILSDVPEQYTSRLARKVLGLLKEPTKYLGMNTNGDVFLN